MTNKNTMMKDNFDLKKYLKEGRLFEEARTPRYSEGKISIEDKIKAIVPLWKQYLQSDDRLLRNQIKDKVSKYTTYDDEFGGGSYVWDILDKAKTVEDVAKIVKREESQSYKNRNKDIDFSVELLVPKIYFNVETGELSDTPYEWGSKDELKDMDITNYKNGNELSDWVFDNDYDTAKQFESEYPNLLKIN
jgi:hypothetical protein